MSFMLYPHAFKACHLHFAPAVQNNDAIDSKFSRIIYSTKHISLNGVAIIVDLAGTHHDPHYNKVFVRFDPGLSANKPIVSQLHDIECNILSKYAGAVMGGTHRCVHLLRDQLNSGCIKAYMNERANDANANDPANGTHVMLKICGIWETNHECGMTYKFIKC
jgi:hypothetical protein